MHITDTENSQIYSHPSINAEVVAAEKPRYRNSRYASHYCTEKNCTKNLHNADILYYKTALYKFFWTVSKNRVIQIRVMENRVNQGMTVLL